MSFEDFLRHQLSLPLPGVEAHKRFVPDMPDAGSRLKPAPADARLSAVLVPLISMPHAFPNVLFTVRSHDIRTHKGQISFPGGRVDANEDVVDAALREMHEETGVSPNAVQVLGMLSPVFIPPSNSNVIPIVGILVQPEAYIPSEREVTEIFDVPLMAFLNPDSIATHRRTLFNTEVDVPYWNVDRQEPLWGATAMILNELVTITRSYFGE